MDLEMITKVNGLNNRTKDFYTASEKIFGRVKFTKVKFSPQNIQDLLLKLWGTDA